MFDEMIAAIQEETVRRAVLCTAAEPNEEAQAGAGGQDHVGHVSAGGDGTVKKQPRKVQEGRPQRSLPLRQRQEVQELLRPGCVKIPGQEDCHGIS